MFLCYRLNGAQPHYLSEDPQTPSGPWKQGHATIVETVSAERGPDGEAEQDGSLHLCIYLMEIFIALL